MYKIGTTILVAFIFFALPLRGQQYPLPAVLNTSGTCRFLQRTMHLLASSTPEKKNTVKILVYGQSISEQDWWLEVKRDLIERFPNARIIMENRAIGGFSSSLLVKTVEMDVSSFYPDLVLFHVYGDQHNYELIIKTIRSRTAAEIALQTDHYNKEAEFSDKMAYEILPILSQKYSLGLIDIRSAWKRYLDVNGYEPSKLLKDDVHLNEHGNFLMAELIKPYLQYKPNYKPDEFQLMITYKVGKDVFINGNTLRLPFTGNKVDVIADTFFQAGSAIILIDGKKPSSFQGTYFMTRPYRPNNQGWPWTLPAMIHIEHQTPWIQEEWTCTFEGVSPPFNDFTFKINGSKTGKDGIGRASHDFISKSKRVIIKKGDAGDGGDWHLNRSFQVLKTIVKPGDMVKWKTYSISTDSYSPKRKEDTFNENITTLFQGIPNKNHVLTIRSTGKGFPIKEIRVYKPYLQ
ncbi:MAG: SGNH/GDSL hydrolase family protein [Ferruginibacter sp.]